MHFWFWFFVLFCLHFSPFLPFFFFFNPKRAENCESFAAFHTCSTQNAEFVNRHNSSGKTNKQPRLAPADTHLSPPQKAAFSAQKRGGRHAHKPKTFHIFFFFFFKTTIIMVFLGHFLLPSCTGTPQRHSTPGYHPSISVKHRPISKTGGFFPQNQHFCFLQ